MNPIIEAMVNRRSVRKFKPEQISEEELEQILLAGTYAASGKNRQAGKIVVVQDAETREQLRVMNAAIWGKPEIDPFYGAPTILVILADSTVPTYVYDGSLVLGNLMLAASALGVGSCWIHRAKTEFESPEGKALLDKWSVPDTYCGIGHCILGYPDGPIPEARPRKEDFVVRT